MGGVHPQRVVHAPPRGNREEADGEQALCQVAQPPTPLTRVVIRIEQDEAGYFVAECPALKACCTQGRTYEEVIANIKDVIALCLADLKKKGKRIPLILRLSPLPHSRPAQPHRTVSSIALRPVLSPAPRSGAAAQPAHRGDVVSLPPRPAGDQQARTCESRRMG